MGSRKPGSKVGWSRRLGQNEEEQGVLQAEPISSGTKSANAERQVGN